MVPLGFFSNDGSAIKYPMIQDMPLKKDTKTKNQYNNVTIFLENKVISNAVWNLSKCR